MASAFVSPYEEALAVLSGRIGKDEAYVVLKERVLNAIANGCDWLSDGCDHQLLALYENTSY